MATRVSPSNKATSVILANVAMGKPANEREQDVLLSLAESYQRKEEKAAPPVLHLPDQATPTEVSRARRGRAVRRGKDVFLPSWRELVTALPNSLLRSALWSVRAIGFGSDQVQIASEASTHSVAEEVEPSSPRVPTLGDITLLNRGPALGSYDRQVFATCLDHYRDDRPLSPGGDSSWIQLSYYQFLNAMNVSYSADSHRSVRASLGRLSAMSLHIRHSGLELQLPRVLEVSFLDGESRFDNPRASDLIYFRVLEPIAELYGPAKWTAVPHTALAAGKGLKSWLASFYMTHSKALPLKVELLHALTGSTATRSKFKSQLKAALKGLTSPETPASFRIRSYTFNSTETTVEVERMHWQSRAQGDVDSDM